MIDRIRFHLDENVDPDIATALRRHDVDVTTTDDVQLRTRGDSAHWEHAQRELRIIVTHDADFLRRAQQADSHSGVAYCRSGRRTQGEIIRRLIDIYHEKRPDQMMGQVVYL
jgi:predicted nuclease of predicted toxin-antitoxin system